MKIAKVEVSVVKIPILSEQEKKEKHTSNLYKYISEDYYVLNDRIGVIYSDNRESVFVKIESDNGCWGYGEALAPTSPEIPASIISDVFAPVLLGKDPYRISEIYSTLYNLHRVRGLSTGFAHDALAAVDIALWDLKARSLGIALYDLAGGKTKESVPYYLSTIKGKTNEEQIEYLDSFVEKGLSRFKLHTLGISFSEDVRLLECIRKKYSSDSLMVLYDGHWRMTPEEAVKMGNILRDFDVAYYECPIVAEDVSGHRLLRDRIVTGIAVGETMRTAVDFIPYTNERIASLLQPDIGRTGLSQFYDSSILAKANNIRVAPHLSTHIGPALCSTLAISFALDTEMVEYQPDSFAAFCKIGKTPIGFESDGFIRMNENFIGNGCNLDLKELAHFTSIKKVIGR